MSSSRSSLHVGAGWLAAALALLLADGVAAAGDGISVRVTGLRNDQGQVGCMLFASADGFPAHPEKATAKRFVAISGKVATCLFDAIPAGTYAIVAMHDENGNGKMDTNFLGVPTEGFGASRDARGLFGPSFRGAAFRFAGGSATIPIGIRY